MRIIEFAHDHSEAIQEYESKRASAVHLGDGFGDAHIYAVHFQPGGEIGEHETGFEQLFLVVVGTAWVTGEDGRRVFLRAGQGAHFVRGERHSKGSQEGATVIMAQFTQLQDAD
jgi:quercetin dioxygenase-like cupin family protein